MPILGVFLGWTRLTLSLLAPPASEGDDSDDPVRVAIFDGRGVSQLSRDAAAELIRGTTALEARFVTPRELRAGALTKFDVVVFLGGSGSAQGKSLGDDGREIVRRFVAEGGGYVGICAGAYLALQGEDEFHKLRIAAAHNLTGDAWKRGNRDLSVQPGDGTPALLLHYENGPVLAAERVAELRPLVPLATFVGEIYSTAHGTGPDEMPGTPAIAAGQWGRGRVLLFSPNPMLGEPEARHPELFVDAVEWTAQSGQVGTSLRWRDVFDGS